MRRKQAEVVTFKADDALLEAMRGIRNRSDFIRTAVLSALENICPVCKGSGILTPNQKRHWEAFARDHQIKECGDCHEYSLVCRTAPRRRVRHTNGREKITLDFSKGLGDPPSVGRKVPKGPEFEIKVAPLPDWKDRPYYKPRRLNRRPGDPDIHGNLPGGPVKVVLERNTRNGKPRSLKALQRRYGRNVQLLDLSQGPDAFDPKDPGRPVRVVLEPTPRTRKSRASNRPDK